MPRRRILILDAHPDPTPRLVHALCDAYAEGVLASGRPLRRLSLAGLDFPDLAGAEDFEHEAPPDSIAAVQGDIEWAEHILIAYPLWMGGPPARLKALFEQVFRPSFAADPAAGGRLPRGRLRGRSARLVVTMGMPALAYRWWFGAHGTMALSRSILGIAGISPVGRTYFGGVGEADADRRAAWIRRMHVMGAEAL